MSWLSGLLNTTSSAGVTTAVNAIGDTAIKLRTAITGDMPPEVQKHLADIEAQIAVTQIELNKIASGSTSLFIAGWRPATGWLGVFGLAYNAIIAPLFGLPMSPDNTLEW